MITIGLVAVILAGCASPHGSVLIADKDIADYRAVALRAMNSPAIWRSHFSPWSPFVERQVDPNREIEFEFQPGVPSKVTVWIPTLDRGLYVFVDFDDTDHKLIGIGVGGIH